MFQALGWGWGWSGKSESLSSYSKSGWFLNLPYNSITWMHIEVKFPSPS